MAEMLKFRKGTHAKLLEQSKVAGTIYVTTDEKAMYVDIDNNTRIRLGQTVNFATLSEFQTFLNTTIPPYSTEAFYYIEDKNALLRWKSSSGTTAVGGSDTKGEWIQINSTQAVTEAITEVSGRVSTLEGTVGSATTGLVKDVNDLKTTVGNSNSGLVKAVADNAGDIKDLQDAIGMGEGSTTGSIGATVSQLVKDLDQAESDIDALEGTVSGHTSTLSDHTAAIAANAKAIADQATADAAKYATIASLNQEIQDRQGAIAQEVIDRNAKVKEETDRATGAESALSGRITSLETADYQNSTQVGNAIDAKITAARTLITKEIDDDVAALKAEVVKDYATKSELTAVDGKVSKNAGDISTLSGELNTYKTTVDNTYAKKANVYTKDETYTKSQVDAAIDADVLVETNRAKAAEKVNADAIATLQGTVNKLDGDATIDGSVKQQIKVAKEALQAEIDADIRAANAMEFMEGVSNSTELPATAKNGATYVAEGAFELNGNQVLPGDLLIATGSEDPDTGLITSPSWTIIHTGYDSSLEQTLKTVDGKIQLTSAVGNANNGQISFVAATGSAATVSVANNTVTVGIEWDNF